MGNVWWDVSGMSHSSLQDLMPSLMRACENGHAEVVKILVSAGAHVNDQNEVRAQRPLVTCILM